MLVPVSIYVTNPRFAAISRLVGLTVGTLATLAILFVPIFSTSRESSKFDVPPVVHQTISLVDSSRVSEGAKFVSGPPSSLQRFKQKNRTAAAAIVSASSSADYDSDNSENYPTQASVDTQPPAPVPEWILARGRLFHQSVDVDIEESGAANDRSVQYAMPAGVDDAPPTHQENCQLELADQPNPVDTKQMNQQEQFEYLLRRIAELEDVIRQKDEIISAHLYV
jgi:hypothetical protein